MPRAKKNTFNTPPQQFAAWPNTFQVWRSTPDGSKDLVATTTRAKAMQIADGLRIKGEVTSIVYIGGQKTTGSAMSRNVEV